jgi:hypothetical protein
MTQEEEVFSLPEGRAVLAYPHQMSADSFEDFEAWLRLVLRKLKRRVDDAELEAEPEPEPETVP